MERFLLLLLRSVVLVLLTLQSAEASISNVFPSTESVLHGGSVTLSSNIWYGWLLGFSVVYEIIVPGSSEPVQYELDDRVHKFDDTYLLTLENLVPADSDTDATIQWRARAVFLGGFFSRQSEWQTFTMVANPTVDLYARRRFPVLVDAVGFVDGGWFSLHKVFADEPALVGTSVTVGAYLEPGEYVFTMSGKPDDDMIQEYYNLIWNEDDSFLRIETHDSHVDLTLLPYFPHRVGGTGSSSPPPSDEGYHHSSTTDTTHIRMCEDDPTAFNICLDFKGVGLSPGDYMPELARAKSRWERVIVADDGDPYDTSLFPTSVERATEFPAELDDLYMAAVVDVIDGRGGILGSTGPTFATYRPSDAKFRAKAGDIVLDAADIQQLRERGILEGLILHEMGHVLGIGPLWKTNQLVNPFARVYTGASANAAFQSYGFTGTVPIELGGGHGTQDVHWSEACLLSELMTGWANEEEEIHGSPLSNITVAALADLGYQVDMNAADHFEGPFGEACGERLQQQQHEQQQQQQQQQHEQQQQDEHTRQRQLLRGGAQQHEQQMSSSSSSFRQIRPLAGPSRRRRLSAAGYWRARAYGENILRRRQELIATLQFPREMLNLGAHFTEVFIMENDHVYSVDVELLGETTTP